MAEANRNLTAGLESEPSTSGNPDGAGRRVHVWVNWALALLTLPGAATAMIFAFGAVMSTAACSDRECPNLGPSGISWGVLFYGAPAVALVTVVVSFWTATRRRGIVVPLCGWVLLIVDIVILAVTVQQ